MDVNAPQPDVVYIRIRGVGDFQSLSFTPIPITNHELFVNGVRVLLWRCKVGRGRRQQEAALGGIESKNFQEDIVLGLQFYKSLEIGEADFGKDPRFRVSQSNLGLLMPASQRDRPCTNRGRLLLLLCGQDLNCFLAESIVHGADVASGMGHLSGDAPRQHRLHPARVGIRGGGRLLCKLADIVGPICFRWCAKRGNKSAGRLRWTSKRYNRLPRSAQLQGIRNIRNVLHMDGLPQRHSAGTYCSLVSIDHVESGRRLLKVKTWKRSFASGRPVRTR
jgi:hypothetical protein